MHKTTGIRDPAATSPLPRLRDDVKDRREANRAVAVSAIGLAATGVIELLLAIVTGSVGLLGDAIHNLSDVSTSAVVFLGFGCPGTCRIASPMVLATADTRVSESSSTHGHTTHLAMGIAGAVVGIIGNQVVARYKLVVGKRIGSATLIADARHSWLDALSSAGALVGLIAVAVGQPWGDPVARARDHRIYLPCRL